MNILKLFFRKVSRKLRYKYLYPSIFKNNTLKLEAAKKTGQEIIDIMPGINLSMVIDPKTYFANVAYAKYVFEPDALYLIQDCLKSGDTVLDVGANIGYFSLFCSKIVGYTGKVIAFEPTSTSFSLLKKNKELNNFSWLKVHQDGLGEKNELVTFNVGAPGLEVYNSLGPITHQSADPERFTKVQINLYEGTSWLKKHNINHIDLMKLDVEGGEYGVLKGMLSFFEKQKVSYLLIEITYEMSKAFGYEPSDIISMLRNCGYNWFELKPYGQLKRLLNDQPEKSGMFVAISQNVK